MRNRKFTKDSPPLYTSPLNSMPQSSIQSNHPRYARYKSFRNLESFSIVLHRYLTFPSPIVFSSFRLFPTSTPILSFFFSPFILVSSASTTAFGLSAQPNFGGLAFPFLAFFPPASSISRVYGKTRKRLLKSARTSEVSQRYFERNMHWRERKRKESLSLVRFQFRA